MDRSLEMIGYLETMDIEGVRGLWKKVAPQFPVKHDSASMIAAIHLARTQCDVVRFRFRAYSHQWLVERGYPSLLPDNLKSKAERIYPVTKSAVGIAVSSRYPEVKNAVLTAMVNSVLDAEAEGRLTDTPFVKARMDEARIYSLNKLFGRKTHGNH